LSCERSLDLSFTLVDTTPLLSLPFVEDGLGRLETELVGAAVSDDPFLDQVTTHLISAGGKRLRPVLALAAATGVRRPASADDILGGVAVELVHLASLYHDDVMDEAAVRRNVDSVNARWGNLVAIVAGDFLLARSAEIAASLGAEIAGLLANTLGRLCQGQVTEVRGAYSLDRTEDNYFRTIEGKTAALMSTSCRIGALTGGLDPAQVDALTAFGRGFGVVFQLRDDILDVVASDADLGKPAGQDLAEGIYTLPVLLALRDPDAGDELRDLLGQRLDQPERDKARAIVTASGAIEAAVTAGHDYVRQATRAAAAIEPPQLRDAFDAVVSSMLDGLAPGRDD